MRNLCDLHPKWTKVSRDSFRVHPRKYGALRAKCALLREIHERREIMNLIISSAHYLRNARANPWCENKAPRVKRECGFPVTNLYIKEKKKKKREERGIILFKNTRANLPRVVGALAERSRLYRSARFAHANATQVASPYRSSSERSVPRDLHTRGSRLDRSV